MCACLSASGSQGFLLGGSWVVMSELISRTIVITRIKGLTTLPVTTHEPPSTEKRPPAHPPALFATAPFAVPFPVQTPSRCYDRKCKKSVGFGVFWGVGRS